MLRDGAHSAGTTINIGVSRESASQGIASVSREINVVTGVMWESTSCNGQPSRMVSREHLVTMS